MSTRYLVLGLAAGLMLYTSPASAQSASAAATAPSTTPPPSATEAWQGEVVPYLWGSGIEGPVGIGNRTADIDASFANILNHLHFAAMGLAEVRRDKLVVLSDVIYTDLRGQHATPGPLFSRVDPQQRMFILTPEGGYRILDSGDASLDVVGGIRYWRLKSELQFQSGVLPGIGLEATRNWVDGIVGARARRTLPRKWWASAYGDLGAGGSDFTCQIVGNAGLDIRERYALVLGYRYLKADYDKNEFLFDTAMKGPLFGFTFKF
jgi:hypothetical protein